MNKTLDFIKKSLKIHGDKYNYQLVNYVGNRIKVTIICPIHGEFTQSPHEHLSGKGCINCGFNVRRYSKQQFIDKANLIHNFKYNYDNVNYINCRTKIDIICPKHGIFTQDPHSHLKNRGCPNCVRSKGAEQVSKFLLTNNINFTIEKIFNDCRFINPLPFDFYIDSLNTCIEYNGKQHYEPVIHFGGQKSFNDIQVRDKIKKEYCHNNSIPLIIIPYWEKDVGQLLSGLLRNN